MDAHIIEAIGMYALRVAIAIGVLLLARFLAGRARAFTQELLRRPQVDQALSSSVEGILIRFVYYGIIAVGIMVALAILGVPAAAIVSVTSAFLVVFAIALRESLSNFAATVVFMIYQPFYIGEEIETMGRRGIVREIQIFSTVLRQPDRSLAVLPNGKIQESGLINYTRLGIQRVDLAFRLKYDANVDRAREIIMKIMNDDSRVLKEPPPAVVILNMGEDGLEMQARPFVNYPDYDPVQFGFRQQIAEALTAASIEFAVPQRDVYLGPAAPEKLPGPENIPPTDQH